MSAKIIEFGVCSGHTNKELSDYVNLQLKIGFQLHGFVYTSVQQDKLFFHQAMVKESRKVVARKTPNRNK